MDPNAALELLREWAEKRIEDTDVAGAPNDLDAAQAWQDLDRWLTNGGFLPKDWAAFTDYRAMRKP